MWCETEHKRRPSFGTSNSQTQSKLSNFKFRAQHSPPTSSVDELTPSQRDNASDDPGTRTTRSGVRTWVSTTDINNLHLTLKNPPSAVDGQQLPFVPSRALKRRDRLVREISHAPIFTANLIITTRSEFVFTNEGFELRSRAKFPSALDSDSGTIDTATTRHSRV